LEECKDDEEREREEKKHHLYQLKQQLEQYLQELPVVGFNTGKYDINAMKVDFFTRLVELVVFGRDIFVFQSTVEGFVRWQLADVEFIQRGHPLVREEPFLFCTLVGFQVLTGEI
jgi:hypothetical protein